MNVVNVNQVGTFLGMRSVLALMKGQSGASIVNISSADGMRGTNGLSRYASSKWAVRGLTRVAVRQKTAEAAARPISSFTFNLQTMP